MDETSGRTHLRSGVAWILGLALIKVLLHFLTNGSYGYFRDEYYYIACSERLAWGYVDQPPLSIVLLWLARQVMGDSVFAVRFLAVAAEAGVVVLAGLMARAMGGGTFAQVLAALVTLMTPVFLALGTFYSMNALEHFFWALAVYVLVMLILALSFSAILVVFLMQRGAKSYYVAPAFPMLIAPGALAIERFCSRPKLMWSKILVVLVIVAGGCLTLPITTPILSIERFVAYQRWLGMTPPQEEVEHTGEIPQLFADRFGWKEMTEAVAKVYRALPADDRARCGIFTRNYGEAAALEFHGKEHGLPPVISGHNNYWLWGYGDVTGDVIIAVGIPKEDLEGGYESVEWVTTHSHDYAVPEEQNVPICVCRERKQPIEQVWPRLKIYI